MKLLRRIHSTMKVQTLPLITDSTLQTLTKCGFEALVTDGEPVDGFQSR